MKLAEAFNNSALDDIQAALDGGILKIYSVARPASPDLPVIRSGLLATYQFSSPAFGDGAPQFLSNPVNPEGIGTPGFARAFKADGVTPVADFSAGAGDAEVKLNEVSATPGYPLMVTKLTLDGAGA